MSKVSYFTLYPKRGVSKVSCFTWYPIAPQLNSMRFYVGSYRSPAPKCALLHGILSLPSSNPNSQSRSQSLFQTSFFLSLQYISSRSSPCLPFPYPNFFTFPLSLSYLTLPCSLPLVSVQQFKYNNTQPAYQPNPVQVMMDRWMQRIIRWGRSVYT